MQSPAHAVRVVDDTFRPEGLDALLDELGFTTPSRELDTDAIERLGLLPSVLAARVAVSDGSLRALIVEIAVDTSVRDSTSLIARQLAQQAPHLLWLVVVVQRSGASLAIATWRCLRSAPRIVAMVTERGRVIHSDAETLCALSAASVVPGDVMRHMRWLDILGRDAVTLRFFRALSRSVTELAASFPPCVPYVDAREMALLTTSRLLFLSFLETKGWLDSDFGFLANGFSDCMANGGNYQQRVLAPLFFGTLNTRVAERAPCARAFGRVPFLNGGLFARTSVERVHRRFRFSDDALGALFGEVLVRYRFTAREDATNWSQAAIDPEMLGKVFESLMETGDRKRGGVFYTPQHFVERVTHCTLAASLQTAGLSPDQAERLLSDDRCSRAPHDAILDRLSSLRILDPACGSGAFLVHALERLASIRIALGDARPLSDVRRFVLSRSIFGVDSNPTAVWLCELRLWLSAVIDSDPRQYMQIAPLPNLDRQIRVGDSLSGNAFTDVASRFSSSRAVAALRHRYARSSGQRKRSLGRQLDIAERSRALSALEQRITVATFERREILRAARMPNLFDERRAPAAGPRDRLLALRSNLRALRKRRVAIIRGATPAFAYATHFSDAADAGGFDAVIGNPPWVRVHNMTAEDRARYREQYSVFRSSAWADGARGAQAGSGFGGQVDLAALFIERSADLLAHNGTLGLLLPSKLWRSLAGGGVRQLILERTNIHVIEDHSAAPDAFDAAVYPSILIASRKKACNAAGTAPIRIGIQRAATDSRCMIEPWQLPLDSIPGSPWLLLPSGPRKSFDLLRNSGIPLSDSVLGRPYLGVKTGCNDAFVVDTSCTRNADTMTVSRGPRRGEIESCMLRPLVRGETLSAWRLIPNHERIIWTHGLNGDPLHELPPGAHSWLARSRRQLESRSDLRTDRWWSLFRTESAQSNATRVVWADFGKTPRAAIIEAGDPTVPLNTCYAVRCSTHCDALAFAAIMNSGIAAAWLSVIAEPARGGYHRYMAWTVARLPIPIDWPRARRLLAPVASEARDGAVPDPATLNALVLDAYGLPAAALDPLLAWTFASPHE